MKHTVAYRTLDELKKHIMDFLIFKLEWKMKKEQKKNL